VNVVTNEKRPVETKSHARAVKERTGYVFTASVLALILLVLEVSPCLLYPPQNQASNDFQGQTANAASKLKAAILDQLSLTFPNQTFVEVVTAMLTHCGYTVDYYPGEDVTVEAYRDLPSHGYNLIMLRVHSSDSFLFTSQMYNTQAYVYEQLTDQILRVQATKESETYFGITENFITQSMRPDFNNTIIILMGCNGLHSPNLTRALFERGAGAVIGWNGAVSASHTDLAITTLIQKLVVEKQPTEKAVENTVKETGPDPIYDSCLQYYLHEGQ
jgi:hypothetical protein